MVFAAVFLCVGIVTAALAAYAEVDKLYRLIPIGIGVTAATLMLVLPRLFKRLKGATRFLYMPIMLIIGVLSFSAVQDIYGTRMTDLKDYVPITGVVGGPVYAYESGSRGFVLTDAYADGVKLNYDMFVVFIAGGEIDFNAGDTVSVNGARFKEDGFAAFDTDFTAAYESRVTYAAYAGTVIKLAEGKLPPLQRFVHENKRRIAENTRSDTAGLAIGMLFGDTGELEKSSYNNVVASGLIHILCVSGLHVGFLAGAVYMLLKKLKVKGVVRLIAAVGVALLYAVLCGFRPSAIRAVVMLAVLLSAGAFGLKYDAPSALGLAAILILIFDPLALFGKSFLLSFGAIFGLVVLYKPLFKIFRRLGKTIGGTLAASLAANIALLPLVAVFFGKIQILFWLSNLIILPIISFIFIIMFVIMLITSVMPVLSFILASYDILLVPMKLTVLLVSSWRYAEISVPALGVMSAAYYLIILIASRFAFATRKQKVASSAAVASVCMIIAALV
jgi:ComEC/Rec2-related protein